LVSSKGSNLYLERIKTTDKGILIMKRMLGTLLAMVILIMLAACGTSEKNSVIPPEEYAALRDKYFLLYGNILNYTWNDPMELEPEIFPDYCAYYYYAGDETLEAGHSYNTLMPQDIIEPMVQSHFDVSIDFLRSGSAYIPEGEVYDVHVFDDSGSVQITSAEQNDNLLTICYDMINSQDQLTAQGTVIIDVKDKGYKYVSNYNKPAHLISLEHNNSEESTQEPDAALPRATNVEGQIEQIKNGYFSNVTELSDYESECLRWMYEEREMYEWVECDLNGNGLKGLLWRQKYSSPLEIKRIEAIFAIKDDEARLVDGTFGRQGTDLFFLAKNGNIINRYGHYGTEDYDNYTHYIFHDDWSVERADRLTVIRIYDWAIEEKKEDGLYDGWLEEHPYWAKAGVYYFANGRDEALDEPQFLKAFEEMTGYSFYDDNPLKPDWVNR